MSKKVKFGSGSPLSIILFVNLKNLYNYELRRVLENKESRNKIHAHSLQGITAFPLAGAVWEAIINEQFTSDLISTSYYKFNLLFTIIDEAEKWNIKTKTLVFPQFFFGNTFEKSSSLFADFTALIQIRNNITHYKHSLYEGPEKAIKHLRTRKFSYPKPEDVGCPWHMELFTTECIRFCINTIASLVQVLSDLETPIYKEQCIPIRPEFFSSITKIQIQNEFKKYGVDPNSIEKDIFTLPV